MALFQVLRVDFLTLVFPSLNICRKILQKRETLDLALRICKNSSDTVDLSLLLYANINENRGGKPLSFYSHPLNIFDIILVSRMHMRLAWPSGQSTGLAI